MKKWGTHLAVLLNLGFVLWVAQSAIQKNQEVLDGGTTFFLKLAPVDPRSLMQGDYMVLGYALPREESFREVMQEVPTRGQVVLTLDEQKVGSFQRLHDAEGSVKEGEVLLNYRKWRRGYRFGIESFFFQEGFGEAYEAAEYAEIKVSSEGEAVLVDLRGKDLAEIDPQVSEEL